MSCGIENQRRPLMSVEYTGLLVSVRRSASPLVVLVAVVGAVAAVAAEVVAAVPAAVVALKAVAAVASARRCW